jgi:hypothetical protein
VQRQQRKTDAMTSFGLAACSAVYYQVPHCRFLIKPSASGLCWYIKTLESRAKITSNAKGFDVIVIVTHSMVSTETRSRGFNFNSQIHVPSNLQIFFLRQSPTRPGGRHRKTDWPDDVTFPGSQFRCGPFVAFPKRLK